MMHAYFGSGHSDFHENDIKDFVNSVSESVASNSLTLQRKRLGLNRQLQDFIGEEYPFDQSDLLFGNHSLLYWQDDDGKDYGGLGISIPFKEPDEENSEELLPIIASIYTQDLFTAVEVDNPDEYDIADYEINEFAQVVFEEDEPNFYSVEFPSVRITHDEVDATLLWYGVAGEDYINFYGVIENDEDRGVREMGSIAVSTTIASDRLLSTEVPVDPLIIGGFDWSGIPGNKIQRFKTPIFDTDLFVDVDEEDNQIMLIGEETIFQIPDGRVLIQVGHTSYNRYTPPANTVEVDTNIPNEWGGVFYYTADEEAGMETLYGRFDYSSKVFIKFQVDVEQGFVGSDNYYKLLQYIESIEPVGLDQEEVFRQLITV